MSRETRESISWIITIGIIFFIGVMVIILFVGTSDACLQDCEIEHHLEYHAYYSQGNVCLCKTGEGTGLVNIYE